MAPSVHPPCSKLHADTKIGWFFSLTGAVSVADCATPIQRQFEAKNSEDPLAFQNAWEFRKSPSLKDYLYDKLHADTKLARFFSTIGALGV